MQQTVLYPDSPWRIVWNHFALLGGIWYALSIPFLLLPFIEVPVWTQVVNVVLTLMFTIDIFIHFRTAYLEDGDFVTAQKLVRRHYVRTWFALDLVATFPWDMLVLVMTSDAELARYFTCVRMIRLARVVQFSHKSANGFPLPLHARIILIIFWIIASISWIADGWLVLVPPDGSRDVTTEVVEALYWTVVTLASVGYGDITPKDNLSRIYSIFVIISGVGLYGLVIGNIASMMTNANIVQQKMRERMAHLASFLHQHRLPSSLRNEIFSFYRHILMGRAINDAEVLDQLPGALRNSILEHITVEMLKKVELFRQASPDLLKELAHRTKQHSFMPGEVIIHAGDIGREMYFLIYGVVSVLTPEGTMLAKLRTQSAFGEMALLYDMPRVATVQAITFCNVFELKKEDFDEALRRYPAFRASLELFIQERLKKSDFNSA
ncbi:MAG: cyclic nucleotide-binding domain-containing protein [Magnetococcales bacterium]|nr:cyclic nucleotide-binding domain-containing protein [Magnetococcales bacterium]